MNISSKTEWYALIPSVLHNTLCSCPSTGKICDVDWNELPPNSPPPDLAPQCSSDDWSPYESHIQFELANFLYRCNQMSEGDTDFLLNIIKALLVSHDRQVPFHHHTDMQDIIDATTVGEASWDHFTLYYNGPLPEGVSQGDIPRWVMEEHEVWYCNSVTLLENLLLNPDFKDEFDYVPYQECTADDSHQFHDFMPGNWSW